MIKNGSGTKGKEPWSRLPLHLPAGRGAGEGRGASFANPSPLPLSAWVDVTTGLRSTALEGVKEEAAGPTHSRSPVELLQGLRGILTALRATNIPERLSPTSRGEETTSFIRNGLGPGRNTGSFHICPQHTLKVPENLQTSQRLLSLSHYCHRPLSGPAESGFGAGLSDPQEAHFTKSAAKLHSQASEHLPHPPAGGLAFAPHKRGLALLRSLLWRRCQAGKSRKGQCPPPRPGGSPREVRVNHQCAQL